MFLKTSLLNNWNILLSKNDALFLWICLWKAAEELCVEQLRNVTLAPPCFSSIGSSMATLGETWTAVKYQTQISIMTKKYLFAVHATPCYNPWTSEGCILQLCRVKRRRRYHVLYYSLKRWRWHYGIDPMKRRKRYHAVTYKKMKRHNVI